MIIFQCKNGHTWKKVFRVSGVEVKGVEEKKEIYWYKLYGNCPTCKSIWPAFEETMK